MSKLKALLHLRNKFPNRTTLHAQLFDVSDSSDSFVPFVKQRDQLGRICRNELSKCNSMDFHQIPQAVIRKPLTKLHKQKFNTKSTPKRIFKIDKNYQRRKPIYQEIHPFYPRQNYQKYYFPKSPAVTINGFGCGVRPRQTKKQSLCARQQPKHIETQRQSFLQPVFRYQWSRDPRSQVSFGWQLKLSEQIAEQFKRFETRLDWLRNYAVQLKSQTVRLKINR